MIKRRIAELNKCLVEKEGRIEELENKITYLEEEIEKLTDKSYDLDFEFARVYAKFGKKTRNSIETYTRKYVEKYTDACLEGVIDDVHKLEKLCGNKKGKNSGN